MRSSIFQTKFQNEFRNLSKSPSEFRFSLKFVEKGAQVKEPGISRSVTHTESESFKPFVPAYARHESNEELFGAVVKNKTSACVKENVGGYDIIIACFGVGRPMSVNRKTDADFESLLDKQNWRAVQT